MWVRGVVVAASVTVVAQVVIVGLVLAWAWSPESGNAAGFAPNAVVSLAVLLVALVSGLLVKRLNVSVHRALPWVIALISFGLTAVPVALLVWGDPQTAALMYRGLGIPQGIERFWDMALVMRSIDCSSWGFDVFAENNGCLQDPAIYAPGMLWLQVLPVFSFAMTPWLGIGLAALASLGLAWLARSSSGIGQVALLVAAIGVPWLLLLERGNIDAVVILAAIAAAALVRRFPRTLWPWAVAALLAWLMGTWKYYPFAMGLMLLPVLTVRRGWVIITSYAIATLGFVLFTWDNLRFSFASNEGMTEIGDLVVLGRTPVVARLIGSQYPVDYLQWGDALLLVLAVAAACWGAGAVSRGKAFRVTPVMLALAGSSVYLVSVLFAGFGWGYKTAFLLLCVPLLAFGSRAPRIVVASLLPMLLLLVVASSTSANTLLASLAGITVASFALGLGVSQSVRAISGTNAFGARGRVTSS